MGRPVMPIGGHGNISATKLEDGQWQALARFRDRDGVTRRVKATGRNKTRAIRALEDKLERRARLGGQDLTADSKIKDLAEAWFATVDKSPGTRDTYRGLLNSHILPRLGENRLWEVTTGRVEQFIAAVAEPSTLDIVAKNGRPMTVKSGGPTAARMSRTVLGLMFRLAVRHDAVASNPVRESVPPKTARADIRALTVEEFGRLRANVLEWQDSGVMGPRKSKDLIDKVDLFIATGLRPGELLGLLWSDVDFTSNPATIEVTGTIKRTSEKGLHRQAYPKTEHGKRILGLPAFAVTMLRRRKLAQDPDNPLGLIFPSAAGSVLDPGNFRRQWVDARGEEFEWVKPGGFRKAVATLIERDAGSMVASQQLGHSSDGPTRRHYIERNRLAPDTTRILERFAGGDG
ncbi:tyrosine-type recombinase/integrase [Arthrobacter luteolus]|uniref:tyrosine-type recombinase/integrase n=1 Tax=Arthrobacter luteolus TaxID=98672 RepID=UPI00082D82D8|nr:tyrosine-type recombinase/integrase [Arthrobacter luteolus]